jgi:hypothetical protein
LRLGGWRNFARQKVANELPEFHEFGKFGGFAEIPICAEGIHLRPVSLRIRGGNNQDHGGAATGACAQPAQYVAALVAGHVDVEQDEIRTSRVRIGIRLVEKSDRLLAVIDDMNLCIDFGFLERLPVRR